MSKAISNVPYPGNEPVQSYAPGSPEKKELKAALAELKSTVLDIPMIIGGEEIRTDKKIEITPPHEHKHVLGHFHQGDETHVHQAINAAKDAKKSWSNLSWEHRVSIFLKAADLLAGPYRAKMNAATMLGQSKSVYQAEIDASCELIDFLKFNAYFIQEIYMEQPDSLPGMWNRTEYRPLEGFVAAITPFNFTSIGANLAAAPAMMGNTVLWKPSETQIYSAWVFMEIMKEAGLPDGVINIIYTDGPTTGDILFKHPDLAGVHFTGSTKTFQHIWKSIGANIEKFKTYPRIVGETGGKDFIVAHRSADAKEVATAITRGAFEYQGQKCSAASRVYIDHSIWNDVEKFLLADLKNVKMGSPEDFRNFFNAVIDKRSFDKISKFIDDAKNSKVAKIIAGGNYDDSKGYYIEPTVILTEDPQFTTMCEEIFGPVVTIYVYKSEFNDVLKLVDETSPYALTGAIFARDRYAVDKATKALENAAGNFYINDKPTGAVVGQQPFGGARASGTNDKAGSAQNLHRWVSVRTIKETFVPAKNFTYPFMDEE